MNRTLGSLTAAVALVLAGAVPVAAQAGPGAGVHPNAYRDQPPLAYVAKGRVFVLDGKGHRARLVRGSTGACCVAWAPDGAHVAFQRSHELWIADVDGTSARRVTRPVAQWEWASDGEALAAVPVSGTGVDVYAIDRPGVPLTLLRDRRVIDLAWAPLGRRLAVSTSPPAGSPDARSEVIMLEVPGPYGDCPWLCPEPHVKVEVDQHVEGGFNLLLAGWSPDADALGLWTDPLGSASIAMDGLELALMSPFGGRPTLVATTLVKRSWVRWSKVGDRFLVVAGEWRGVDGQRTLQLCRPASGCRALTDPADAAVDPAWSDDGRMAFVHNDEPALVPPDRRAAQYAHRHLWIADGDGNNAHEVRQAGGGVAAPRWLPDSRHLVFVRDHLLWLLDAAGGAPVAIAGWLDGSRDLPDATPYEPSDIVFRDSQWEQRFSVAP